MTQEVAMSRSVVHLIACPQPAVQMSMTSGSPFGEGLSNGLKVPVYRVMQPQLNGELRRARRYEYPLGIVVLSLDGAFVKSAESRLGTAGQISLEMLPVIYNLLGGYLRNVLRENDILAALPESFTYAAMLPHVDRGGAGQALRRFCEGFASCASVDLQGGAAAFPGDGLTIEDVLEHATAAWQPGTRRNGTKISRMRYSHG